MFQCRKNSTGVSRVRHNKLESQMNLTTSQDSPMATHITVENLKEILTLDTNCVN